MRLCLIICIALAGCSKDQPLQVVDSVDLSRYTGLWYDIASYPVSFQKDCHCTTAEYQLVPGKDYIRVINRCIRISEGKSELSRAEGKAFVVKGSNNARLKVQFFWPFRGDYYITALADDYSWAVVGHPSRKYLWILSRESFMPTDQYEEIVNLIRLRGYNPALIRRTPHNCEPTGKE